MACVLNAAARVSPAFSVSARWARKNIAKIFTRTQRRSRSTSSEVVLSLSLIPIYPRPDHFYNSQFKWKQEKRSRAWTATAAGERLNAISGRRRRRRRKLRRNNRRRRRGSGQRDNYVLVLEKGPAAQFRGKKRAGSPLSLSIFPETTRTHTWVAAATWRESAAVMNRWELTKSRSSRATTVRVRWLKGSLSPGWRFRHYLLELLLLLLWRIGVTKRCGSSFLFFGIARAPNEGSSLMRREWRKNGYGICAAMMGKRVFRSTCRFEK